MIAKLDFGKLAMLNFPVKYTFVIVGKTNGDAALRESYVDEVKRIVSGTSGVEGIKCEITPRGKTFTKVQVEVEVQSAAMINSIYDDLGKLEVTVMKF